MLPLLGCGLSLGQHSEEEKTQRHQFITRRSRRKKRDEMRKPSLQTLLSLSSTRRNTAAVGRNSEPKAPLREYGRLPGLLLGMDGGRKTQLWLEMAAHGPLPRGRVQEKCAVTASRTCFFFPPPFLLALFRESISVEENKRHWVSPLSRRHWLKYSNLSFKQK